MSTIIDNKRIEDGIRSVLNAQLYEIGDEMVERAIADISAKLRKRLAELMVTACKQDYSIERDGNVIRIEVKLT